MSPRFVDLSYEIYNEMPVFPRIYRPFIATHRGHADTQRPGGVSSHTSIIITGDHAGTHIDSTLHFNPRGESAEKIPLDVVYGPATALDLSHKKAKDPVSADEVAGTLEKHGIDPRSLKVLLFRTGASDIYQKPEYFDHYLEFQRDTVNWMLDHGIKTFGVDASTIDHAQNRATHMLVREREYYHIENLANVDQVIGKRFTFIGFPLKLRGASASPIRAVAVFPDEEEGIL